VGKQGLGHLRYSFDLEDLLRASAEVLGKGAFGTAYKAVMENGSAVAVKRLKDVDLPEPEFRERIAAIGAVQHELVVPLRAYYFSKDEKLLVYDYMSMGSLSALLHGKKLPPFHHFYRFFLTSSLPPYCRWAGWVRTIISPDTAWQYSGTGKERGGKNKKAPRARAKLVVLGTNQHGFRKPKPTAAGVAEQRRARDGYGFARCRVPFAGSIQFIVCPSAFGLVRIRGGPQSIRWNLLSACPKRPSPIQP